MAVIEGGDLLVKWGDAGSEVVLACETTSSLNITQAEVIGTCKGSDRWTNRVPGDRDWSVSGSGLYDPDGAGGFIDMSDLILTDANDVTVVYGQGGSGETIWTGKAMLTTTTLNGPDNEMANYDFTFMANGPLVKGTVTP